MSWNLKNFNRKSECWNFNRGTSNLQVSFTIMSSALLPHDQLLEFEIILSHHVVAVVFDLNFVGNCALSVMQWYLANPPHQTARLMARLITGQWQYFNLFNTYKQHTLQIVGQITTIAVLQTHQTIISFDAFGIVYAISQSCWETHRPLWYRSRLTTVQMRTIYSTHKTVSSHMTDSTRYICVIFFQWISLHTSSYLFCYTWPMTFTYKTNVTLAVLLHDSVASLCHAKKITICNCAFCSCNKLHKKHGF